MLMKMEVMDIDVSRWHGLLWISSVTVVSVFSVESHCEMLEAPRNGVVDLFIHRLRQQDCSNLPLPM